MLSKRLNIARMLHRRVKAKVLTDSLACPADVKFAPTSSPSSQMEWHMHVADKVDQELEGFARDGVLQVATLFDPVVKQIRGVTYSPEDVYFLGAIPSLRPREEA